MKIKYISAVYRRSNRHFPVFAGKLHEIHGIVEVQRYQDVAVRRKRNIVNQRFYAMENVLRSAHWHLVPTKSRNEAENGSRIVFYVNNYVSTTQGAQESPRCLMAAAPCLITRS
jgi:hypothetical protein